MHIFNHANYYLKCASTQMKTASVRPR